MPDENYRALAVRSSASRSAASAVLIACSFAAQMTSMDGLIINSRHGGDEGGTAVAKGGTAVGR